MSSEPIDIARTFFAHWNANRIDDALAMLSEDVLYDNVPFPNIVGRENVRKFHAGFGIGTDFTVDWKVTAIAAARNVVLNERIDVFLHLAAARSRFRSWGRSPSRTAPSPSGGIISIPPTSIVNSRRSNADRSRLDGLAVYSADRFPPHSHSIVPGGLLVTS